GVRRRELRDRGARLIQLLPLTASRRCALPEKISAFSSAVSAALFTDSTVGRIDSVGPLSDPNRMRSAPNTFAAIAMPLGPRPPLPVARDTRYELRAGTC